MKSGYHTILSLCCTACLLIAGDGTDPYNPYDPSDSSSGDTYARFERSELVFRSEEGFDEIAFTTNCTAEELDCTSDESWCHVNIDYDVVSIYVEENTWSSSREAKIKLINTSSGNILSTLSVTQYGTGNDDNPGGDPGDDNPGGGDETETKPAAPSRVWVENYGTLTYPDIRISWMPSDGAISYEVYRSTSEYGTYSLRGKSQNNYYSDSGFKIGNTYFYKIKACNSAGKSEYSDCVGFDFKDTRKPGPVQYGNCTVSGGTMTLRWTVPTQSTYGKPTTAYLKVRHPNTGEYVTIQTLSGTATSASFAYGMWIDSDGFVRAGILLENENGTGDAQLPKVYDTNQKNGLTKTAHSA
ncbi:MAG: hypothetical protein ACI30A_01505 [Paludibacteraceae bacterium]